MLRMGVDTDDPGFEKVLGLRVSSRGATVELPWPELETFPGYGLVMPREGFDDLLMQLAVKAGARFVEATDAVGPLVEDGRVRGAMTRPAGDRDAEPAPWRARL